MKCYPLTHSGIGIGNSHGTTWRPKALYLEDHASLRDEVTLLVRRDGGARTVVIWKHDFTSHCTY